MDAADQLRLLLINLLIFVVANYSHLSVTVAGLLAFWDGQMALRYGYLRGTFGMPYGGYCMRPTSLDRILLQADNDNQQMFCVVGRYREVADWLCRNDCAAVIQSSMRATFTHELVAEVYTKASALSRMIWGLDAIDVQLVVRIARTWDRRSSAEGAGDQFHPLLKLIATSGISLSEIRDELRKAVPGKMRDTTRDRKLLCAALARVSTRGSASGSEPTFVMPPSALPR
ncbi:hypothetical protein GGF46_000391 [Coemansia sp. RSA 552]|nr:hypothetical protein GGF46_000391 [Coemansia sp. RSA 552]